jgi:hypothetical protein
MSNAELQKKNRRLGLILASVAAAFLIGFVAKLVLIGG